MMMMQLSFQLLYYWRPRQGEPLNWSQEREGSAKRLIILCSITYLSVPLLSERLSDRAL